MTNFYVKHGTRQIILKAEVSDRWDNFNNFGQF